MVHVLPVGCTQRVHRALASGASWPRRPAIEANQVNGLAEERVVPASLGAARQSICVMLNYREGWRQAAILFWQVPNEDLGSDSLALCPKSLFARPPAHDYVARDCDHARC